MAGTPKKRQRKPKPAAPESLAEPIEQAVTDAGGAFSMQQTLLIAQIALQGGENIKAAAAAVGVPYRTAMHWHNGDEQFRTAVKLAAEAVQKSAISKKVRDWTDFHGEAQQKMATLMRSKDDRVSFNATQEVLNRIEGKPIQRTKHEDPPEEASVETPLMALAVALVFANKAPNLAAALEVAQRNPTLVQAYASRKTLPAAPEGATAKEQERTDAEA